MARKTVAERSEQYQELLAWVQLQADGQLLSYEYVTRETGVVMDEKGRDLLRLAMQGARRSYSVIPRVGYELAKPENAQHYMRRRLVVIDHAFDRADHEHEILTERFEGQFDETQSAFFHATKVALHGSRLGIQESIRRLEKAKERPQLTDSSAPVIIPKNGK